MKMLAKFKGWFKRNKLRNVVIIVIISVVGALCFNNFINGFKAANVKTINGKNVSLFIATGSDFQTVKDSLYSKNLIINRKTFEFAARKLDYDEHVKPGHYIIKDGMTNEQLINMLRIGKQTPVKVIFNNIRNIEQLAGRISKQIEADSLSIIDAIRNDTSLKAIGFNDYNYASLFIPNTYEFYWNTDANGFLKRMSREYKTFWNESRLEKAKNLNLTPLEISTLASIVDKETTKVSEMPTIAGVYINRLKKHWPLQADPTLIFAIGDYNIRRVLDVHKMIDSPYNTYKRAGLPPGPICIPSIAAIDAVLNAEKHKYFYFCAKDNLSGYHVFATNISQHNINAEKYRRALNKNRIYR